MIYPFLLQNSENIEDAKLFMQAVGIAVRQSFMNRMLTTKVDDLKLVDSLDPAGKSYFKYKEFFNLIGADNITEALTIVEGMPAEIDMLVRKENEKRSLSELKTEFL